MDDFLKVATLSAEDAGKLRILERELGKHIMAFEPGLSIASLSDEELKRVKALESQLGVTLLVFDAA